MSKLHKVEVVVGADFQDFDRGENVSVFIPEWYDENDVESGDRVHWICAQFDGIAEIISREGRKLIINDC